MTYTLKSGAKIEGNLDQIMSICKSMNETVDLTQIDTVPSGFYLSSKGLLKISGMNDHHIRNALLKKSKEYFESLGLDKKITNSLFLKKYTSLTENKEVIDLFSELSKR